MDKVRGNLFGQVGGKLSKPPDLLDHCAKSLLKGNSLQLRHSLAKLDPAVLFEKECSILEPRPQDPFIACTDDLHILRLHVGDRHKIWEELAGIIRYRKVALLLPHGVHDHFTR